MKYIHPPLHKPRDDRLVIPFLSIKINGIYFQSIAIFMPFFCHFCTFPSLLCTFLPIFGLTSKRIKDPRSRRYLGYFRFRLRFHSKDFPMKKSWLRRLWKDWLYTVHIVCSFFRAATRFEPTNPCTPVINIFIICFFNLKTLPSHQSSHPITGIIRQELRRINGKYEWQSYSINDSMPN